MKITAQLMALPAPIVAALEKIRAESDSEKSCKVANLFAAMQALGKASDHFAHLLADHDDVESGEALIALSTLVNKHIKAIKLVEAEHGVTIVNPVDADVAHANAVTYIRGVMAEKAALRAQNAPTSHARN